MPNQEQRMEDSEQREDHASGSNEPLAEEEASVCSSEACDRKDLEECPGVDLRAVPRENSGVVVMVFHIVFSFISFAFMLAASCPIPWLRASDGRKWTVWKDESGTLWKDYACDHKRAMFQAMEAFAICGCVISLACFIAGVMQVYGVGHLGVTFLLSFINIIVLLTDWALLVNQYHKYNCPNEIPYVAKVNRLNAGFALVFCSFALMLFGTLALVYWAYDIFVLSEIHRDKFSRGAFVSTLATGAVLTIATVGTTQTMFEQYYENYTLKIAFWHIEFYNRESSLSEYWDLNSYHCSSFKKQMHAGAAFSILSDAFLFVMLLCSIGAVYQRCYKWIAIGFGVVSWATLAVCWAIVVSVRYKTFCKDGATPTVIGAPMDTDEQRVSFEGFVITDGLGLIISAWCATTLNLIYLGVRG
ncbi:hypothetical protein ABL78_2795 [Leptomonas seymouri]|uniref:Amastin-like protein n=1 Tax=Leptomonas seymouri TaxID=5684 RepID=A0A0N1PCA2_LEPSE|nr:hypothetical protein ABL78_2795 [Leptomonas seymouri]|eukprot:KPI88108.1 hypothetical protein ABL78_2795 [Leptomonas seymouri]